MADRPGQHVSGLGSGDYRDGAPMRLRDARVLREQERWLGAIYLTDPAGEGMLRALLWSKRSQQEVGHDLRDLLKRVRALGMLTGRDDALLSPVNEIVVLWSNDLRFVGEGAFRRRLERIGRLSRDASGRIIRGDPVKANALGFLDACQAVVARGELAWRRRWKK